MASLALDLDTNKAKCDNPERLAQGKKKKKSAKLGLMQVLA